MSYEPPPPPPPPPSDGDYGQPAYGAPQPAKNNPLAIVSLVLGIVGILPCFWSCFVFAIGAAITGYLAKGQIAASNGAQKGEGMAKAGWILGLIAIALGVIYWILVATNVIDLSLTTTDVD